MEDLTDNNAQCFHLAFIENKCIKCNKSNLECGDPTTLPFNYIQQGLTLTLQEINNRRNTNIKNLISHKKLKLILDLDHTLIHARLIDEELSHAEIESLRTFNDVHYIYYGAYVVKLRPGVREFLNEVSSMFDLSVFTLGGRDYASRLVKVLCEDNDGGVKFTWVIAMEDCLEENKKVLDVVLCHESVALIVDDNELVWGSGSGSGSSSGFENVVKIGKYEFRPLEEEVKGMDEELARVLSVLREVHKLFYDGDGDGDGGGIDYSKKDVRVLLKEVLISRQKSYLEDLMLSMKIKS